MRFLLYALLFIILIVSSLLFGARQGINIYDLASLFYEPSPDYAGGIIMREMRFPRTIAALIAGSTLAIAGGLIQSLTRNSLADPGLLGVNSGAAFALIFAVWCFGQFSPEIIVFPALLGALITSIVIGVIGASSSNKITLILAGVAINAILLAGLRGLILIDKFALDAYRHWVVGSLDVIQPGTLKVALFLAVMGGGLALAIARNLDTLSLGDDLAQSLGCSLFITRALTLLATILLSTSAVLVAGPLVFIGLVAPHFARLLGAQSTIEIIVYSALFGAVLVLIADIAGRVILPGVVIEAGIGITIIGSPFLIYLVRKVGVKSL